MRTAPVAGVDVATAHFIDGKRVASKRTFAVCSQMDGKQLADVSAGGAEEIDPAAAAASRESDARVGAWNLDFFCNVKKIAALKGSLT